MRRRDASKANTRLVVSAVLLALYSIHAITYSAELTEIEIRAYRGSGAIPDYERTMSIDEVFGVLGRERWASSAIKLRCLLADDQTRKSIYQKLAQVVIYYANTPYGEFEGGRVDAITILGQQVEHPEEAAAAILTVLDAIQNPTLKLLCYRSLGRLGGDVAIETLKEVIVSGPATADELGFSGPHGTYNYYEELYNSLASCGQEAGHAFVEIDKAHGEYGRHLRYLMFRDTANEEVVPYLLGKVREAKLAGDVRFQMLAMRAVAAQANTFTAETRQEILDLLLYHAQDPDYLIRAAAARGLGDSAGDASHLPLLERMQQDAERVVQIRMELRPGSDDPADTVQVPTETFPVRDAATLAISDLQRRLAQTREASTP